MLNHNKVNTQYMKILENNVTGQAYIFSYPDGDNSIVLVGGANTDWTNFNPQNYDEVLNKSKFKDFN